MLEGSYSGEVDSSTLTVIASYGAIVLTIVLFLAEWRRREVRVQKEARHLAVQSVIAVIESSARQMSRPAIIRPFFFPETEFTIAMVNLSHALDNTDRAVGEWAMMQAVEMKAAATDREALAMSIRVAGYLSEWSKGDRDRAWFENELTRLKSTEAKRRDPRRLLHRSAEQLTQWFFLLGTAMIAVFLAAPRGARQR